MLNLIIGNFISAVASVFLAISNCAQSQKKIYQFQLLETATFCVSSVFFSSWAGLSTLLISLVRNILVVKGRLQKWHVYLFAALVVLIGLNVTPCQQPGSSGTSPYYGDGGDYLCKLLRKERAAD